MPPKKTGGKAKAPASAPVEAPSAPQQRLLQTRSQKAGLQVRFPPATHSHLQNE